MSINYIVADIGGTNARFARVTDTSDTLQEMQLFQCADYLTIGDAINKYLSMLETDISISKICLAVAGPIEHDWIDLPNNHWAFSLSGMEAELGFKVAVINDFTAQLLSVFTLQSAEMHWLGCSGPVNGQVIAALGAGTGLGVAGMTVGGEIIPSEGGHIAFAPVDEHEVELLRLFWQRFPRVSVERILSGPGLSTLHWANSQLTSGSQQTINLTAEQVSSGARKGDALCQQTIHDFIRILGSVAGEIAIGMGARGGVYLAGGILPRLQGLYSDTMLRERFNSKGRFTAYCEEIPLGIMQAEHTGLRGCVHALRNGFA